MASLDKVNRATAELSRLLSAAEISLGKEDQVKVVLSRLLSVAMEGQPKEATAMAKEVLHSTKALVKVARGAALRLAADLDKEERSLLLLVAAVPAMAETSSSKVRSAAFNRRPAAVDQTALRLDKVDASLLPPALHLVTTSTALQITALGKAMVAHREVDSSHLLSARHQVKDSPDAVSQVKAKLSQTENLLKATVASVMSNVKLVDKCHQALAGRCLEVLADRLLLVQVVQLAALDLTASASLQKRVYNGSISSSLSSATLRPISKRLRTRS